MHRVTDRASSPRDTVTFLVCAGLSVLALYGPPSWGLAVSGAIRGTALVPLLWLQTRAEEAKTSRARLTAVERARDSAVTALANRPTLEAENTNLRGLLGLAQRLPVPYVPAEVLHQAQATDARTLLLGAGLGAGVAPFDPVLSPEGLIGVVRSVGPAHSLALTWAHPDFRVSAITVDGQVSGIVSAAVVGDEGNAALQLRSASLRDTIPTGTLVVTSGLGGVFPKGIPVGRVVRSIRDQETWERSYLLRPAADPAVAAHVLILRAPRDSGLSEAFPADSAP